MANLKGFNANEVEPADELEPIPTGKYVAVITDSEMKPTKSGSGNYLQLTFQVIEGEYANRLLWVRLNLENPNSTAVEIAMKTACLHTGKPGVIAFTGAYHGLTYGALSLTDGQHFRGPFEAQLNRAVRRAGFPNPFRPPPRLAGPVDIGEAALAEVAILLLGVAAARDVDRCEHLALGQQAPPVGVGADGEPLEAATQVVAALGQCRLLDHRRYRWHRQSRPDTHRS